MPGVTNTELIAKVLPLEFRLPTIVTWNRLEGRPRKTDFSRSLRAEIRDPLWMLARQWQVGEFQHEDAGSAIFARLHVDTTKITRVAAREGQAVAFDEQPPLEARVERETVEFGIVQRLQWGKRWIALLEHHGAAQATVDHYRSAFPFSAAPPLALDSTELWSNRQLLQWTAAAAGQLLDGGELLAQLLSGTNAIDIEDNGNPVPDPTGVGAAEAAYLAAYGRAFTQPTELEPTAWDASRLEYRFAVSAPEPDGTRTTLLAEEYAAAHLDWYAFDVDERGALADHPDETFDDDVIGGDTLTLLPASLTFGGMPAARWWEMEDRRTSLGDVDADTTELAKLLMAQFTLVYANDWLVVPYEVAVGSIASVEGLVVVDTFGQRQVIRPAGRGDDEDWRSWSMFNLSTTADRGKADSRLFLPPVVGKLAESPSVEEVRLFRDEMANMVWGVEIVIPDGIAHGRQGQEAASQLRSLMESLAPDVPTTPPIETNAPVTYVAGTTVPENWIPFIPVHVPGSNRQVQLQRAAMPRLIDGIPPVDISPRGEVLRPSGQGRYFIHEEEIGKAGIVVSRTYQRTRGKDGATYTWVGRRKRTGRDSRASGLRFDQIDEQFVED